MVVFSLQDFPLQRILQCSIGVVAIIDLFYMFNVIRSFHSSTYCIEHQSLNTRFLPHLCYSHVNNN